MSTSVRELIEEPSSSLAGAVAEYRAALEELPERAPEEFAQKLVRLLNARAGVARAAAAGAAGGAEHLCAVADLDARLGERAGQIDLALEDLPAAERVCLKNWREAIEPPGGGWWSRERYDTTHPKTLLALASGVAILVATALALRVALRFFTPGTDFLNASEVLLAMLAGGTFVEVGRRYVQRLLDRLSVRRENQPLAKAAVAFTLFALAFALQLFLPAIARGYNESGLRHKGNEQYTKAIARFQLAVSLHPDFAEAHYNLGDAYEDVLEFDKAAASYRQAVENDARFYAPYNNLARIHIVRNRDFSRAIPYLDSALRLTKGLPESEREEVESVIYKNRGWALLELGRFEQARDDLLLSVKQRPDAPAAHCLLAQALEKLDEQKRERKRAQQTDDEWSSCWNYSIDRESEVEAEWRARAQERLSQGGTP